MNDPDVRLIEARAMPIAHVVDRLEISGLMRTGVELVGPCPHCGGRDRFGVNTKTNVFLCRRCDGKGDQIALVMLAMGMDFRAALTWLCGPAEGLSDAEREQRRRKAEANRIRQEDQARRQREKSIEKARQIWADARPAEGTLVRDYLARRGISASLLPVLPVVMRFAPAARYLHPIAGERGRYQTLHVGPAMVCAVVDAGNAVTAVHQTWLDLDAPKGKFVMADPNKPGEYLPAKKVMGSKKGSAIRLRNPRAATTMVMAEGVETTLSAMAAGGLSDVAYWCGVDLGNMAGLMQRGAGLKFAGLPDMTDDRAFVPPPWVRRLIYVQDGDSDPRMTRAKLLAGLRRAKIRNPELLGQIVHPGEGRDLNDLLMGQHND